MNWAVWVVLALAGAILCLSAWVAGGSPRFWWGMGQIVIEEGLPKLSAVWKAYKASRTPEQWRRTRDEWDRRLNPHRYN